MVSKYLNSKPACKIALIFILGLVGGKFANVSTFWLSAASIFLILTSCIFFASKGKYCDALFVLAIFSTAMLRYSVVSNVLPPGHISEFAGHKREVALHGNISGFPVTRDSLCQFRFYPAKITLYDSLTYPTNGKIIVKRAPANLLLSKGDKLIIRGKLRKPREERNPGEFNYAYYLKSQGIHGFMYIKDSSKVEIISKNKSRYLPELCREYIDEKISAAFQGQTRAVLKGLLIGERGEIAFETREAFSISGTMHVLAVSGLHVGFIVFLFASVFRLLRIRFRAATILTIGCNILYMAMIGFKPPVVRASTVIILFLLGKLLQRRSHPINLLSSAALIILFVQPLQLFQVSFQLSFVAVLSIFIFYEKINNVFLKIHFVKKFVSHKLSGYLFQLFIMSSAVSCGTLPITALYFERIPLLSIFINILVVPLVGLIISLGFAYVIVSAFFWQTALLMARLCTIMLSILIQLVTFVSELNFASIPIYRCEITHVLLIYIAILLAAYAGSRTIRKLSFIYLLILMNLAVWCDGLKPGQYLEVLFFDVGQGDAALLKIPGDKYFLIDSGNSYEGFTEAQRHILPYLQRQGIKKIEAAYLSHADNDHVGGFPFLMRHLSIKKIYDSGKDIDSEIYLEYQHLIDSLKIERAALKAGDKISLFNSCNIFVLHPQSGKDFGNQNNHSLVLKLVHGDISFLFTGDIEKEVERDLLPFGKLMEASVLKVAHHGSSSSTTTDFINCVNPEYAVISVGEYNRFRHPSKTVTRRLQNHGIKLIRTDTNGAVIFQSDGKSLTRIR